MTFNDMVQKQRAKNNNLKKEVDNRNSRDVIEDIGNLNVLIRGVSQIVNFRPELKQNLDTIFNQNEGIQSLDQLNQILTNYYQELNEEYDRLSQTEDRK